eukprot:591025_1
MATTNIADPLKLQMASMDHSFDPLGQLYESLLATDLIQQISIGSTIAAEIMKYFDYVESTLDKLYDCRYTKTGYVSNQNDCEIAHLIIPPKTSRYKYVLKTFKIYCGVYQHKTAELIIKIGKFKSKTERIGSETSEPLLFESPKITIDKYQVVEVNDINIVLEPGQMYVIEPDSVTYGARARNGYYNGTHDEYNVKFTRSDFRWRSGEYHFRNHVRKFECVFGIKC